MTARKRKPGPPVSKVNHAAYARLFADLLHGPANRSDLAEVSGLHIKCVRQLIVTLRKFDVVHRCAWEPNKRGKMTIEVFELGRGKDAPKPPLSADALRSAARRARLAQAAGV